MTPVGASDPAAAVADAARRLAAQGLLVGTAGNVSVRDGERCWITVSGAVLAETTPDDVVAVPLAGGEGVRASSELELHRLVYAARPEVGAVVHTHAPYSTAVACVLPELPVIHYQQLLLGGAVRVAPYATFGSPALAEGVAEALTGRQAALLANHGSVAVGPDRAAATEHAVLLEWLAALHHRASVLGTPRVLSEAEQTDVVLAALARRYGEKSTS
ncbi:class II aldolase/adducin family protein [Nocardioides sp.]|uniref:class II aldolase/adducin family protein n=1 Tax=Nocardioides sp. TaxID=35761 RepID=UPI003513AD1A